MCSIYYFSWFIVVIFLSSFANELQQSQIPAEIRFFFLTKKMFHE